jgi:hypothetical protein
MLNQWHWAAQYLATAAKSFIAAQEDDSHTNLGYDRESARLFTHPLFKNQQALQLDLRKGILQLSHRSESGIPINGKTHHEVIQALKGLFENKAYTFDLHYELPFEWTEEPFQWSEDTFMMDLRAQAHLLLEDCSRELGFCQEVRVWPHHFDSGVFGPSERKQNLHFGMGLAVPDSLSETHYYYLSAYSEGKLLAAPIETALAVGEWVDTDFEGGILRIPPGVLPEEQEVMEFYRTTTDLYIKHF